MNKTTISILLITLISSSFCVQVSNITPVARPEEFGGPRKVAFAILSCLAEAALLVYDLMNYGRPGEVIKNVLGVNVCLYAIMFSDDTFDSPKSGLEKLENTALYRPVNFFKRF